MMEQTNLVPKRRFKEFQNTHAWEQRKVGKLADIVRGASPRPIQDPKWFDDESDIGWLRIADVTEQNGRIHYLEQRISKAGQEKTRVLTEPHLLLSIAATVGKPVVNYVKTGVHDGFLIFHNPKFDREFMFQWLEMFRPKWQKYGQPGSQVNLNSDLVKNQEIVLPSEEEQKKISDFFAQLDHLITLHQRKLEKTKALKSAYLSEMFPAEGEREPKRRFAGFTHAWEQRKLGEVADIIGGGTPSTSNEEYWDGEIDWYSPVEIGEQTYFDSSQKKITELGLQKSSAKILPIGTVLFTSRAGIGNTAILAKEGATNQGFQSIVPHKDELDSYFIYSRTHELKRYGETNGAGSTFVEVSGKQMAKMPMLIPTLEEQKKIGGFFERLDHLIALHQRKLEKLQNIKKAYLNEMFV
ncbi:restriction endonuclease subunit S [Bacillus thuringiensis]|uniref:restriction endonuclease subunit S n=1 Tax=Bacillus thuringiensis TaxID=1428 RepID=UPI000BFBCAEB|nr:restriction endonuclease subunit S [Bacillus thuringiensis]PGW87621.1 restriction endonuclease subunit S [Bacillus thuringiensis]